MLLVPLPFIMIIIALSMSTTANTTKLMDVVSGTLSLWPVLLLWLLSVVDTIASSAGINHHFLQLFQYSDAVTKYLVVL